MVLRQEADGEFLLSFSPQKDEPDAFKELGTGNRIATWLFYVSTFSGFQTKWKHSSHVLHPAKP